jgi:hypothetical protein
MFDAARRGLLVRRTRILLSSLGIAIGIGSMVSVVGISSSAGADLDAVLNQMGTNLLTVSAGRNAFGEPAVPPRDGGPDRPGPPRARPARVGHRPAAPRTRPGRRSPATVAAVESFRTSSVVPLHNEGQQWRQRSRSDFQHSVTVPDCPSASVAVTVTVKFPVVPNAPRSTPVAGSMDTPYGSPVADHRYGPTPPAAASRHGPNRSRTVPSTSGVL